MPTILVADDNSNIQKMVSLAFQEKGIRVVAVGNGEAACRKVTEVRPDVVLADVFMPVRNGYEVCEFVKQDPEFAETPVILLVGAFDPLDEKEAARVGANGVLKKPFVPPDPLISLVSSLLGKDMPAEQEAPPAPPAHGNSERPNIQYTTPRPEPPRPPQEFAFGSDENDTDGPMTYTEPQVTPAEPRVTPEPQNDAAADDDLGPENAWAQRRKTMDYEIDAADSADLVERLAGTKTGPDKPAADEDEILVSDKQLPFGGANVPEIPPAPKWMDFLKPKSKTVASETVAPPAEATAVPEPPAPPESYTYDATPPDLDTPSSKAEIAGELAPSELLSSGQDVIPFRPPVKSHSESPAPETSVEPPAIEDAEVANSLEAPVSPSSKTPEIEIEVAPAETWFEKISEPNNESRVAGAEAVSEKMDAHPQEIFPAAPSEMTYGGSTPPDEIESASTEEQPAPETANEQTDAKSPASDDGLVNDVVAKVFSKLEPQLHQALKDGVLRPLVEELLNEKGKKK